MSTTCPKCHTDNPDKSKFCMECATPFPGAGGAVPTKTIETPLKGLVKGSTITGKYKILGVLGRGGMGVVYKAEDSKLKRTVALKFLSSELTQNPEAKERFILEAQAASALDHNNICTVYEIDESDGQMFIAMAYVDGQSLKERIVQGPFKLDEALDLAVQIAAGLHEAHEKGIVHRDIKSSNIMVTAKGQAMIMDFGIAKLSGERKITQTGTTMGTVAYMSPEQAQGEEVDHRSDIWSFGIVLYEMLCRELPFKGDREASILYSVVHEEPKPLKALKPDVPSELQQIINRALKKKPKARYTSASEMLKDLHKYQDSLKAEEMGVFSLSSFIRLIRRPIVAIPALLAIVAITISAIWFFNRQAKIRWAKDQGIPEINRFIEDLNYAAAFHLVEKVEKYIPREQRLIALLPTIERYLSFQTNPKGANVYRYDEIDSDWKYLGLSPIDKVRTSRGYKRWKIEMEGFETVEGAVLTSLISVIEINLKLDKKGSLPPGMVRMYGGEYTLNIPGLDHLPPMQLDDYLIDKYEVNNKEFKNFVENGGYEKRDYWKHPFIKNGHVLTWEEAMAEFKDKTGRTGPAAWETGDYPNGLDDYPVSGISWYEAAAYAEFARKSLPSIYHWNVAASTQSTPFIVPFSNFNDQGPAPVGEYKGMSPFGTYDMAGNVREWCFNASENKRFILGGGWNDQTYMFNDAFSQPPFDRSMTNGFRCIKYLEEEKNLEALNKPLEFPYRDFMKEKPVSDEIFQIYLNMYAYDKTNLNAEVESVDESAEDWIKEKISFDAAYGNERIIAYLFLPKTGFPPYQTIVFFPGSNAIHAGSSERFSSRRERNIDFILKTGRAVIFPIYKGTYERKGDFNSDYPAETNTYKEYLIMQVKDFARSIDYLETRKDIDTDKLAYYGVSWGGAMGAIIPAVENRLKVSILYIAGLTFQKTLPEVDAINYITRVKIPVLMLNGRYDHFFPLESSQKPMFDLLGTPLEHKRPVIYETGHTVPRNQLIKETLAWLDRYLGPVK